MKYTTVQKIVLTLGFIITLHFFSFAQCIGDNTFHGTVDSDWNNPENWSRECVPTQVVTGKLVITSNCIIDNNVDVHFIRGSILEIQVGTSLSNSGNGTWTIEGIAIINGSLAQSTIINEGLIIGNGTVVGNITGSGNYEPGTTPSSNWNCGDLLIYGDQQYGTVLIGDQCWMSENLNLGVMIDGNLESQNNNVIEKYCYNNDPAYCVTNGGFYSWMEAMAHPNLQNIPTNQGVCPTGWHIPTDEDWMELEGTVDTEYPYPDPEWELTGFRGFDVSKKLKSTFDWNNNENGTDDFGFRALPAGYRDHDASGADFFNLGAIAHFWSSTNYFIGFAKERQLWGLFDTTYRGNETTGMGYSIRCVKN